MEYPMDWGMDSNPRNIVDAVVSLEIGIMFKAFQISKFCKQTTIQGILPTFMIFLYINMINMWKMG